jgi:hypothetical protein
MNVKQWLTNRSLLWCVAALAALLALLAVSGGGGGGTATRQEKRMAQVLSLIEGAGRVEVALFYASEEGSAASPTGAVAVAQGADALSVRLELIRAARTLLSLPEEAVDVFVMNDR